MIDDLEPHENLNPLRQYNDNDVIYRAVPRAEWLDENAHPTNDNYLRRECDKDGLSVAATIEECLARFKRPVHGMMELRVGDIRALGLKVRENRLGHSIIEDGEQRIPFSVDNPIEALRLADKLLELSKPAEGWQPPE